jgi:hypothetical protein
MKNRSYPYSLCIYLESCILFCSIIFFTRRILDGHRLKILTGVTSGGGPTMFTCPSTPTETWPRPYATSMRGSGLLVRGLLWRMSRLRRLRLYLGYIWPTKSAGGIGDAAEATAAQVKAIPGATCFGRLVVGWVQCGSGGWRVRRRWPWRSQWPSTGLPAKRRSEGPWPPLEEPMQHSIVCLMCFFFTCPPLADHKQGDGCFFSCEVLLRKEHLSCYPRNTQ